MSTINSAAILDALDRQMGTKIEPSTTFQLNLQDNAPCRKITADELRVLAIAGHVCARWRGQRILSVQLIVPADVAFADAVKKVREAFHTQANQTTQRVPIAQPAEGQDGVMPGFIRRHHAEHCSAWGGLGARVGRVIVKYDGNGRRREIPAGPVDAKYL